MHVFAVMNVQKYRLYIKASPEAIWDALTKPEWSIRYGYAPLVDYELEPGGKYRDWPPCSPASTSRRALAAAGARCSAG